MIDQTSTAPNPNDWLMASGSRSASFLEIATTITGFIMRPPDMVQARDIDGKPKYFDNGDKVWQQRVFLMTEEHDPTDPDDSGERTLYLRGGNMQKAVAEAVRQAGASGLEVGGKLQVRYSGQGTASRRGFDPPKLYTAKYKRPEPQAVPVYEPPTQPVVTSAPVVNDEVPF